jgi:hypothetical protein
MTKAKPTLKSRTDELREMTKIACAKGTWDYDPYFHGMANGMIFALALLEGKEPTYLEAPKVWTKDLTTDGAPVESPFQPVDPATAESYKKDFLK